MVEAAARKVAIEAPRTGAQWYRDAGGLDRAAAAAPCCRLALTAGDDRARAAPAAADQRD